MSYLQLIKVLEDHEHFNLRKADGHPCYKCKTPIPVIIIERPITGGRNKGNDRLFVDRSNRVDVVTDSDLVLSYHVRCWEVLIYDGF